MKNVRLAVDIGGTFTDVVLDDGARRWTAKVLTTPDAPARGFLTGVRQVLAAAHVTAADVRVIIHGTTLGTNALIERKGARTAFLTTAGFRDILEIGYEDRFEQYDLMIEKPRPLVPRQLRFTVPERIGPSGNVILPLDREAVEQLVPKLEANGIESLAIGFLQAYANPAHERIARDIIAARLPALPISLAAEVSPEIREYDRFSTACANAYIQPLMERYLAHLERALAEEGFRCPIFLISSSGAMTNLALAKRFPVRLVESGPAGGALLAARIAEEGALDRVLSFDMGGTTAKICFIDDARPQTSRSFEVARVYRFAKGSGLPLRIPVIELVEIGAGGGSIARIDDLGRLTVGPDSAGADPGPVCYGRGGSQPTVTDADLVTGRIDVGRFAAGAFALDTAGSARAVAELGRPLGLDARQAGQAIAEVIEETMATAARVHAIEGGRDITEYTMIAFGGAAPLHAAGLAQRIGVRRIVIPTGAGVGSAVGFLAAPVAIELVQSWFQRTAELDVAAANRMLRKMSREARALIGESSDQPLLERRAVLMRYIGQGHEIEVELPVRDLTGEDRALIERLFVTGYRRLYARSIDGHPSEMLTWSLRVGTAAPPITPRPIATRPSRRANASVTRSWTDPRTGEETALAVFERARLEEGVAIDGPAAIVEDETTTIVPEGFAAWCTSGGYLVLERTA